MKPSFYRRDILTLAIVFSTLGSNPNPTKNPILSDKLFTDIAQAHGCSVGVVSLSWAVQRGITVIPKSSLKSRIEENIRLVTLTEEEMAAIAGAQETIKKDRISNRIGILHFEMDGRWTMQGWSYVDYGWEDEAGNWLV